MLGRFRMPVHDCIVEYEEMGNQVFGHPRIFCQKHIYFGHRPKFSGKAMKKAIEEVSGRRCEYKDSDSAAGVIFAADSRTRNSICKT